MLWDVVAVVWLTIGVVIGITLHAVWVGGSRELTQSSTRFWALRETRQKGWR